MRRKFLLTSIAVLVGFLIILSSQPVFAAGKSDFVMATVVKSVAFNWFMRMEEGVKQFGKDYGVTAFMQGPSVADSAEQVSIIEQLIAQGVDAIVNVPYGVQENELAQKEAMEQGIIVVTHEAASTKLKSHPNLKGILGSAAGDVVGAGQAVEEAGLSDEIAVVGTSIVSYAGELLATGAVDLAMCWDPATAGYAANVVAYKLLKGETIEEGMDLGVPGYTNIHIVENEHGVPVIYGQGWILIDADNMDEYQF